MSTTSGSAIRHVRQRDGEPEASPTAQVFIPSDSRGYRWRADRQDDDTDQLATGDERLAPADRPVVQRPDATGHHDGDVGSDTAS